MDEARRLSVLTARKFPGYLANQERKVLCPYGMFSSAFSHCTLFIFGLLLLPLLLYTKVAYLGEDFAFPHSKNIYGASATYHALF